MPKDRRQEDGGGVIKVGGRGFQGRAEVGEHKPACPSGLPQTRASVSVTTCPLKRVW
jgi:hypothetical protein